MSVTEEFKATQKMCKICEDICGSSEGIKNSKLKKALLKLSEGAGRMDKRKEFEKEENHALIIRHYGRECQLDKMVEELGELKDAIDNYQTLASHPEEFARTYTKFVKDIKFEMADVYNMLAQLELMFGEVSVEREFKMMRTLSRIEKGE